MEELKAMIGRAATFALMQALKSVEIAIEPERRTVTVWKYGQDPITIKFEDIERFVNESH